MMEAVHLIGGLLVLGVLGGMYFLPAIVAFNRKHAQRGAIFLLNFLLGWSVLGWIIAIVWSMTNSQPQTVIVQQSSPPPN
jgi:hypothetical protein